MLLIARAPLQLFQAIQTSILPHLTRLRAGGESDPFRRSVNLTLMAIAGFAGCVALVMLAIGPWLMDIVFGGDVDYEPRRPGAGLARHGALPLGRHAQPGAAGAGRAPRAASAGSACAAFALFLLLVDFDDRVLQVEIAYLGAAVVLCALLYACTGAPEILARGVTETLTIPSRFNGPPGSANGGYTCGLVAGLVGAEEPRSRCAAAAARAAAERGARRRAGGAARRRHGGGRGRPAEL